MSRLIDADALIEEIRNKIPVYRGRNTFMSFVDDMPTAYDPESVAFIPPKVFQMPSDEEVEV